MVLRCRRWTLSWAPLACSWTLSEQSESKQSFLPQHMSLMIRRCTYGRIACTFRCHLCPPSGTTVHALRHETCTFEMFLCFNRLASVQKELDETKSKSTTTLLANEDEILQLKAEWVMCSSAAAILRICSQHTHTMLSVLPLLLWSLCCSLQTAHEKLEIYKRKLNTLNDYEQEIRLLRDEVSYLGTEKAMLQERCVCPQYTHANNVYTCRETPPHTHTHRMI